MVWCAEGKEFYVYEVLQCKSDRKGCLVHTCKEPLTIDTKSGQPHYYNNHTFLHLKNEQPLNKGHVCAILYTLLPVVLLSKSVTSYEGDRACLKDCGISALPLGRESLVPQGGWVVCRHSTTGGHTVPKYTLLLANNFIHEC